MVRAILGVVVGFIVGGIISFGLFLGLWFALGVDGVLEKGKYEGTMVLNIVAPLTSILGGLVGGLLCAKISRSTRAVATLAAILFAMLALGSVTDQMKPNPGARPEGQKVMEALMNGKPPMWFSIINPLISAGGVLLGGCCLGCRKKK
jgi:hypothetical protein